MRARLLGWAGVQLEDAGSTLVIDPLADAGAVWDWTGDRAAGVALPPLVAAEPAGAAAVGLLTHLHLDHADAQALTAALAPGAPVLAPVSWGGGELEQAGVAVAQARLEQARLALRAVREWDTTEVDGWRITALPAADGNADPQVSWLIERGDATVVHAGDTLYHHWWWRVAHRAGRPIDLALLPVNGARMDFPHRRPPSPRPSVMDGTDAVLAAAELSAARMVPIHHGAYDFPGVYHPDEDALGTVASAAAERGVRVDTPPLGEWFDVVVPVAA